MDEDRCPGPLNSASPGRTASSRCTRAQIGVKRRVGTTAGGAPGAEGAPLARNPRRGQSGGPGLSGRPDPSPTDVTEGLSCSLISRSVRRFLPPSVVTPRGGRSGRPRAPEVPRALVRRNARHGCAPGNPATGPPPRLCRACLRARPGPGGKVCRRDVEEGHRGISPLFTSGPRAMRCQRGRATDRASLDERLTSLAPPLRRRSRGPTSRSRLSAGAPQDLPENAVLVGVELGDASLKRL